MADIEENIIEKNIKSFSRNTPIALVVGVAGFLGSTLAEKLLSENIQVLGIDNFSTGKKQNLNDCVKSSKFHLLNISILNRLDIKDISLPRLDYAFFVAESDNANLYSTGLLNFLNFVLETKLSLEDQVIDREKEHQMKHPDKPRIVLASSIELYNHQDGSKKDLREAEVRFARFVKQHSLNGRVVRLSSLYGPKMHFRQSDPFVKLIQASLSDQIQRFDSSNEFSSRALYISDAVTLLIKSVLSGATAQKIYDGALLVPIKVSDVKQILLDPVWHELKGFQPAELPPWPTPNLAKTMKELSWNPRQHIVAALKETITYFKESEETVPLVDFDDFKTRFGGKDWSFAKYNIEQKDPALESEQKSTPKKSKSSKKVRMFHQKILLFLVIALILYGLVYPFAKLTYTGLTIKHNLQVSEEALAKGDFIKAKSLIASSKQSLRQSWQLLQPALVLKRINFFNPSISRLEEILFVVEEGVEGVDRAVLGTESLFKTTKIISGESAEDPANYYSESQINLSNSLSKLTKVKARLDEKSFLNGFPDHLKNEVGDLSLKLGSYINIVDKARAASFLLPEITAINGKRTYLVLLLNNLELRPGGGFIGSYAKLNFEKGRIANIKVDDIYALDGSLKDLIAPPLELKNDLNQTRFYLRDSNTEPDFPTSARQAEFFYKRSTGEIINGVIALDLSASGKLASAVGGLDLPEYGEHIDEGNLFEKAITHAEVNFFPGSQAKKNYLTSLQNQLFNKIFYLSNQNWPNIIQAISSSLEQKHIQVYLADQDSFSYLASENWAGVLPRGVEDSEGVTTDFLATVESNMGANKANFYLDRKYKLDTSIGKEGQIYHKLTINYRNNSVSEVFPGGKYKNRFKVYLPLGTKLINAHLGEVDLMSQVSSQVDYGRTIYSMLFEILPKQETNLVLEYALPKGLNFKDKKAQYRLDILKQAGTLADPFDINMTYPINYQVNAGFVSKKTSQEINITTDLLKDRSFLFEFSSP